MVTGEAKHIDFSSGQFMANGKLYRISQVFPIERYAMYQKFEVELGYGVTFKQFFDSVAVALAHMNKMNFVDAIVTLTDLQRGMAALEEKEPFVLKICALCMNVDGEDITVINDDMITAKIEDWKAEGIAMTDFFRYALSTLAGYRELYDKVTQSILEMGRNPGEEFASQPAQ